MNRRDLLKWGLTAAGTLMVPHSAQSETTVIAVETLSILQDLEEKARKKGIRFSLQDIDGVPLITEIYSKGEVFCDLNFVIKNRGAHQGFLPLGEYVDVETVLFFRHWQRVIWLAGEDYIKVPI